MQLHRVGHVLQPTELQPAGGSICHLASEKGSLAKLDAILHLQPQFLSSEIETPHSRNLTSLCLPYRESLLSLLTHQPLQHMDLFSRRRARCVSHVLDSEKYPNLDPNVCSVSLRYREPFLYKLFKWLSLPPRQHPMQVFEIDESSEYWEDLRPIWMQIFVNLITHPNFDPLTPQVEKILCHDQDGHEVLQESGMEISTWPLEFFLKKQPDRSYVDVAGNIARQSECIGVYLAQFGVMRMTVEGYDPQEERDDADRVSVQEQMMAKIVELGLWNREEEEELRIPFHKKLATILLCNERNRIAFLPREVLVHLFGFCPIISSWELNAIHILMKRCRQRIRESV